MESLTFKKIMRGYDPEEVDKAIADLQHNLAEANATQRELRLQINSLREQNSEWGNRLKAYEEMEKDLRDALLSTQRVASQVKEEAEQTAQTVIETAKTQAEALLRETEHHAEQRVAELKDEEDQAQATVIQLQERISELTLQKDQMESRMEKAMAQLASLRQILEEESD